ncbi:hypothetical protein [uncultured Cetobacterium sp.]|uniref:hypothetical protein n=1 Tax=uncultured Cetobacterium sp. TaxID=527638 RepID=UPI00261D338C|nr:hypothetical protein [uncultured Cetobacterium sp.]
MKKLFFLFFIVLFTGCISLGIKGEYNSLEKRFDRLVSESFKENERNVLENKFISLKRKVTSDKELSKYKKRSLNKKIDYYIMVLKDLKD